MGFLDRLRRQPATAGDATPHISRHDLAALTDRLTNLNPRLRLVPHYGKRLAPAITSAIGFARELVGSLPPTRVASEDAWGEDPYIHACFGTAHDVTLAFSRSPDLRDFFNANPGAQEAHAVLGMGLTERRTLGMALENGVMRSEVPQTTVSFLDHKVRICGPDDTGMRREIALRLLDQLVLHGMSDAEDGAQRRDRLEREQSLLQERLDLLKRQGVGLRSVVGGDAESSPSEREQLHARLGQIDTELAGAAASGDKAGALERQLDAICHALTHAHEAFSIDTRRIRLSKMNVILPDGSTEPADDLDLPTAHAAGDPPLVRTFLPVRFARRAMLSQSSLLDEAERFL